jgi:hypothetical protein
MNSILVIKDLLSIISSLVLIYVGISGLKTWKRQLKGNTEYEQARKLLRAIYKVRDAIRNVRNPFMDTGEHVSALEKAGISPEELTPFNSELQKKAFRLAYQGRLERLNDALAELNLTAFEAEVLWGKLFLDAISPLRKCIGDLFWAVQTHFLFESQTRDRNPALVQEVDEIFWGYDQLITGDTAEIKNAYSKKVIEAIKGVEDFIRPHVRL